MDDAIFLVEINKIERRESTPSTTGTPFEVSSARGPCAHSPGRPSMRTLSTFKGSSAAFTAVTEALTVLSRVWL